MDFAKELNNAIQSYASNNKIVVKAKDCNMDCVLPGERTKCQEVCSFDAFYVNPKDNTIYMDESKCIDCGFCIEICPINCLVDKVQFTASSKLFDEKELSC